MVTLDLWQGKPILQSGHLEVTRDHLDNLISHPIRSTGLKWECLGIGDSGNNFVSLGMLKAKEIKHPFGAFEDWRMKLKVVGISIRSHSIREGKIRRRIGFCFTGWSLIGDDREQSEFSTRFSNN